MYLFPTNSHLITSWGVTGFSLGGHATWQLLRSEPRIAYGAPISGSPDPLGMLEERIQKTGLGSEMNVLIPQALKDMMAQEGPNKCKYQTLDAANPYLGRHILVIAGERDKRTSPDLTFTCPDAFCRLILTTDSDLTAASVVPHNPWTTHVWDKLEVGQSGSKTTTMHNEGHVITPSGIEAVADFVAKCVEL